MLKAILSCVLVLGTASPCFAQASRDLNIDFSFTQDRGAIVVSDNFNKIGKSRLDVANVMEMQRTIDQLSKEVRDLQKRLDALERKR